MRKLQRSFWTRLIVLTVYHYFRCYYKYKEEKVMFVPVKFPPTLNSVYKQKKFMPDCRFMFRDSYMFLS